MLTEINPKIYGLNSRVKLLGNNSDIVQIIKKRKSRLIMKDGIHILAIAKSIHDIHPSYKIELIVQGSICSKTLKLLKDNGISVIWD